MDTKEEEYKKIENPIANPKEKFYTDILRNSGDGSLNYKRRKNEVFPDFRNGTPKTIDELG